MNTIELCTVEAEAPITKTWSEEVLSRNGLSAKNAGMIIYYLQERYGFRLKDFANTIDFGVLGAWLEVCVGNLATELLLTYQAKQVTINLDKTVSVQEKGKVYWTLKRLSSEEKREILFKKHPDLADQERLVLK